MVALFRLEILSAFEQKSKKMLMIQHQTWKAQFLLMISQIVLIKSIKVIIFTVAHSLVQINQK